MRLPLKKQSLEKAAPTLTWKLYSTSGKGSAEATSLENSLSLTQFVYIFSRSLTFSLLINRLQKAQENVTSEALCVLNTKASLRQRRGSFLKPGNQNSTLDSDLPCHTALQASLAPDI